MDLIKALQNALFGVVSHDELGLDSKKDNGDQIKFRFGSWLYERGRNGKGLIVRLSGDILRGDDSQPHRDERMGIDFRQDDNGDEHPDKTIRPSVQIFAQQSVNTAGDATEKKCVTVTADGMFCNVPVYAPNLNGGSTRDPGDAGFKMTSQDGRYEMILQNHDAAGLLVFYDKATGKGKVIATPPR